MISSALYERPEGNRSTQKCKIGTCWAPCRDFGMVGVLRIAEQMTLGRGTLVLTVNTCASARVACRDQRMISVCDARFTRIIVKFP